MVSPGGSGGLFPIRARGIYELPYALSDATAQDLLNGNIPGNDGFIDHIFVGDLGGNFFTIRFNFNGTSGLGMQIDTRLTRAVNESTSVTTYSFYRGKPQPITTGASISFDAANQSFIRAIVGAGRYDDIYDGVNDDKTDPATMSIYNERYQIALPIVPTSVSSGSFQWAGTAPGGMNVFVQSLCGDPSDTGRLATFSSTPCTWIKNVTTNPAGQILGFSPDCCESTCTDPDPCWQCVFDLPGVTTTGGTGGERIINKGLTAGSLYFATSFIPPQDACTALGSGFLYIFGYGCTPFGSTFNPVPTGAGTYYDEIDSPGFNSRLRRASKPDGFNRDRSAQCTGARLDREKRCHSDE